MSAQEIRWSDRRYYILTGLLFGGINGVFALCRFINAALQKRSILSRVR